MATAGIRGMATGEWTTVSTWRPTLRRRGRNPADILRLWDEATEKINVLWPKIPPHRFQEMDTAFGQYAGPVYELALYWIDNEVHHRERGTCTSECSGSSRHRSTTGADRAWDRYQRSQFALYTRFG